jgi:magnesium-protoporphyrin O-methyltransferase
VPDCCAPGDFDLIFNARQAESDARAYKKNGLDDEARRIADAVQSRVSGGATILEVGGGIGAIPLELLRGGASHATNVELSPGYEPAASTLIADAGLTGRVDRRIADFVADAAGIPGADAVILQRVVCCYPDADALVSAAARHADRVLVLTFPIDRWWAFAVRACINVWPRIRRSKFRFFVHRTADVVAAAERQGLRLVDRRAGLIWQMLVLARPT